VPLCDGEPASHPLAWKLPLNSGAIGTATRFPADIYLLRYAYYLADSNPAIHRYQLPHMELRHGRSSAARTKIKPHAPIA